MQAMSQQTTNPESPLICEDNGELSLHFNFPTIQSRMRKAAPERLVLDYTRTMMGFLLLQPKPQRIAMIGLGGGSLAKYCRHKLPDADFTAIELAAEVIALRDEFEIPPDGPNFRILCGDGAEYVRSDAEPSDVLLVDGFDCGGQPEQLCSAAFYDYCYDKLNEGGVLVVNLCADDTGYGAYVGRIRDSFSEKIIVVEAEEGENKIVFAQKGGTFPPGFSELAERLRTLETAHPVDLDRTAQKMLQPDRKRSAGNKRRR
jgi:spermidine synthase